MNKGYWSNKNKPEFYGTTKIILKLNDTFSLKDARYRIFAKDFEDFDITHKIIANHNIDTKKAGTYSIEYSVKDSHGNISNIKVPVIVTDDNNVNPMIERTLYSLPSVDNMEIMGAHRGNNHDKQMLGLFVKANSKIKIRKISGNTDLTFTMLNNDSQLERSEIITTNWSEILFQNDYTPFIKSLYKQDIPIKIEIEWNSEDTGVKELNYYHYKDNESVFFNKWKSDTDSYAVIDGNSIMVLVPYFDKDKLVNYWTNSFSTLDMFLEYYDKVTTLYDMMLGLEYNSDDIDNQNVKTKYFVKANVHGAGAAYYAGDHVGVNNASVASFFEANWGGLHELGHGYQGSLGYGDLDIGEVSNNIFAHYVQMDPDIYPFGNKWLGELSKIEEKYNNERIKGKKFTDLDAVGKLYVLINFLDSFEGAVTYNKIAKYYRKSVNQKKKILPQDAWVGAIAKEYGVNLDGYFSSWGIEISSELREILYNDNIVNGFPMKDLVNNSDLMNTVKADLGLKANYQIITGEQLKKYNITGNVELNFIIDDYNLINSKYVTIKNGLLEIAKSKIIDGKVIFNIPIGAYKLFIPQLIGDYTSPLIYNLIVINGEKTLLTLEYKSLKTVNKFDNDVKIQFQGYYFNDAAEITLINSKVNETENINLNLRYRGTTLFNGGLAADYDYARIQVVDSMGNEKYLKKVGGASEMFSKVNEEKFQVPVNIGDKIFIKYHDAQSKLKFISTLNGDYRKSYEIENNVVGAYQVIRLGIKPENMTDQEFYNEYATRLKIFIENFISKVSDEDIKNKYKYINEKNIIVTGYRELNSSDQKLYANLYNKIIN